MKMKSHKQSNGVRFMYPVTAQEYERITGFEHGRLTHWHDKNPFYTRRNMGG